MRKIYTITAIASLWLGACTTDSGLQISCTIRDPQTNTNVTKEFVTSPGRENCDQIRAAEAKAPTAAIPPATTPQVPGTPNEAPIFAEPVVEQPTAGLVEPTNKAARQEEALAKVSGSQRDPFINIPGSTPPPPTPTVVPNPARPRFTRTPVRVKPVEPPSTVEASAVLVSGILELGGNKFAIINAPGEPTSRSVSVGQTFVQGKVLFKRIEEIAGSSFVVLEQNGIEVTRPVGKEAVNATNPPTPSKS